LRELTTSILVGFASGLVLITVPLHLAEIAPSRLRTIFGTLHQLSIGVGMLIAQSLSLPLGKPFLWRYVSAIGAGIGLVLFLSGLILGRVEGKSKADDGEVSRGDEAGEEGVDEERPLLGGEYSNMPLGHQSCHYVAVSLVLLLRRRSRYQDQWSKIPQHTH
jgi:MFS family permease